MAAGRGLAVDQEGFERCLTEQQERSRAAASFSAVEDKLAWHTVRSGGDSEFLRVRERARERARDALRAPRGEPSGRSWCSTARPSTERAGGKPATRESWRAAASSWPCSTPCTRAPSCAIWSGCPRGPRAPGGRGGDLGGGDRQRPPRQHPPPPHGDHLLQAGLRHVLGAHVAQAGSSVAPERLRFDFTHFSALTGEERDRVEEFVNREIFRDQAVEIRYSTYDEAVREGVTALFGEKYDAERVRRVRVPGLRGAVRRHARGPHGRDRGCLILEESAGGGGNPQDRGGLRVGRARTGAADEGGARPAAQAPRHR